MSFTNSKLISYTKLSPNYSLRTQDKISAIIIHTMAGNCTVEGCGATFQQKGGASSQYGIGSDGRKGMYVEEKHRAWTSGGYGPDGKTPLRVGGITGAEFDHHAVTIEVASLTTTEPFKCSDAAWNSLIELCVDICKRNGIPELKWQANKNIAGQLDKQNMGAHRWFSSTRSCPGNYLYDNMGLIADQVNAKLGKKTNWHAYDKGTYTIKTSSATSTSTTTTAALKFKLNDYVEFIGGNIYGSSCDTVIRKTITKKCNVTITNLGAKYLHQYHCKSDDSTVYGWVDASSLGELATKQVTTKDPNTKTMGGNPLDVPSKITSGFGPRSGGLPSPHNGIDIIPASGSSTPANVLAKYSGTITNVVNTIPDTDTAVYNSATKTWKYTGKNSCGNQVWMKTDNGVTIKFMHLKAKSIPSSIKAGSRVSIGTKIGEMGSTGWSTGPHLHYQMEDINSTPFDPTTYYNTLNKLPPAGTKFTSYIIRPTTTLKVRQGPGTNYAEVTRIDSKAKYTIIAESTGTGAKLWGKLKSGIGWIALDFTKKE